MAAPSFISAGSIVCDAYSPINLTVTLPEHQAGDILVVAGYLSNNNSVMSITEGWTQIASVYGSEGTAWWWKRAVDSETPDPVITATTYDCFAIAYVIRNCVTTGVPFEDPTIAGNMTDSETTPDTAEITTLESDRLALCFLSVADWHNWSVSPPPTGWDLEDDQFSTTSSDARFTAISQVKATAGTISAAVIGTFGDPDRWGSLTLAFIPPAGAIVKTFEDTGEGAETLLADKILLFIETGSGVDIWVLPEVTFIKFSDSGEGTENLLTDKILLLEDSGSGAESWIADKLREFADSGVGVDVFLKDWTPLFEDSGAGVEAYYKVFHYPANLKRVIILIRDRK